MLLALKESVRKLSRVPCRMSMLLRQQRVDVVQLCNMCRFERRRSPLTRTLSGKTRVGLLVKWQKSVVAGSYQVHTSSKAQGAGTDESSMVEMVSALTLQVVAC